MWVYFVYGLKNLTENWTKAHKTLKHVQYTVYSVQCTVYREPKQIWTKQKHILNHFTDPYTNHTPYTHTATLSNVLNYMAKATATTNAMRKQRYILYMMKERKKEQNKTDFDQQQKENIQNVQQHNFKSVLYEMC